MTGELGSGPGDAGRDAGPVRVETVVIGAGQAGLATGYHLARRGRDFVILDAYQRVGDNWRCHWDSLRLYSPARIASLPGMRFPAPPMSYPTKDDMADFLETYASRFQLPVRTGLRVRRLAHADGKYLVTTGGPSFQCDNVVVASGTFGRTAHVIFPVLYFLANHLLTIRTPLGRKIRPEVRAHGGPLIRVKRADLARAGVELAAARTVGVRDGLPVLDDDRALEVANVVWCTGFRQDFSWIDLPVTGDGGWPLETRGVVPSSPGLYFVGLAFQYAFTSMLVGGTGRDAEHVVKHLCAGTPAGRRVPARSAAPVTLLAR